jgi:probable rRNA maturation factor
MTRLNRRFTGREGSTDVLAFPLREGPYLGEVIISAAACRRQAGERGVAFERELALLVVHGVLHLAGHDHTRGAAQKRRMRRLECSALRGLGASR